MKRKRKDLYLKNWRMNQQQQQDEKKNEKKKLAKRKINSKVRVDWLISTFSSLSDFSYIFFSFLL